MNIIAEQIVSRYSKHHENIHRNKLGITILQCSDSKHFGKNTGLMTRHFSVVNCYDFQILFMLTLILMKGINDVLNY